MPKEFNFRFSELVIDQHLIKSLLGYEDTALPSPFDDYLAEALSEAQNLTDIRASFILTEDIRFIDKNKAVISGGEEFRIGKTVANELKKSERLAFLISTAGAVISAKSADLLRGDNSVLGYVYDVLGSTIADAAADSLQTYLKKEMADSGMKITNRYSPGYCDWNVADQHKLFSLFGGSAVGVKLTDSALMNPVKSISGVIGIGHEVKYREYQCALCNSVNCTYRRLADKKL